MRKTGLKRAFWPAIVATTALTACSPSDIMSPGQTKDSGSHLASEQSPHRQTLALQEQAGESGQRADAARDHAPVAANQTQQPLTPAISPQPSTPHGASPVRPASPAPLAQPSLRLAPRGLMSPGAAGLQKRPAAEMAVRGGAFGHIVPPPVAPTVAGDRERYGAIDENPLKLVSQSPVSTFSIDVDTGSYANVRRFLLDGRLPPADAVRVEEMLNYFSYGYDGPARGETPFSVSTELGVTPWNPRTRLLHIGVQGLRLSPQEVPPSNLVFLIDVSGSMRSQAKLGLLKAGLTMLTNQLRAQDRVSMVVYAGSSGVVLEPTPGNQRHQITAALQALRAGGSTHGSAGIQLAYQKARQAFIAGGVNRVLLATDGDFNVGTTDFNALKALIKRERESGVSLTTLGFGTGNLNEQLMEQLANVGNGNYAYIDSAREANKVLVEQMAGTLATIAKDVKIQIEFNPAVVSEYRLIGYENRKLRREDFRNDKVDAGEIGAGHSVTALYEVTLTGTDSGRFAPLRYRQDTPDTASDSAASDSARIAPPHSNELAFLRMRYKAPGGNQSKLVVTPIEVPRNAHTPRSGPFKLAAAVAGFGQLLRDSRYVESFGFDDVIRLASEADVSDSDGYVAEFRQLAAVAKALSGQGHLQSRVVMPE